MPSSSHLNGSGRRTFTPSSSSTRQNSFTSDRIFSSRLDSIGFSVFSTNHRHPSGFVNAYTRIYKYDIPACQARYVAGHRRGIDFSVGGAKLNAFSVEEAKIGEKQSRQSISKYNFNMQYVFFEKKVYAVYMGSAAKPQKLGNLFENFCVKSNLTVW